MREVIISLRQNGRMININHTFNDSILYHTNYQLISVYIYVQLINIYTLYHMNTHYINMILV